MHALPRLHAETEIVDRRGNAHRRSGEHRDILGLAIHQSGPTEHDEDGDRQRNDEQVAEDIAHAQAGQYQLADDRGRRDAKRHDGPQLPVADVRKRAAKQ
jgi:hypothetical protein